MMPRPFRQPWPGPAPFLVQAHGACLRERHVLAASSPFVRRRVWGDGWEWGLPLPGYTCSVYKQRFENALLWFTQVHFSTDVVRLKHLSSFLLLLQNNIFCEVEKRNTGNGCFL